MTAQWLAAGTKIHRTTRILPAIATAISLTVFIACSGNEPPPTDRPDRDQQRLSQTIEAMTQELTALQTETAESRGTPAGDNSSRNAHPAPTERAQTPQLTETPPQVVVNGEIKGVFGKVVFRL